MRGVLNVNKPSGISSYDVIRKIKKILPNNKLAQKEITKFKIGHAGTLDPMANGVLLILFNEATKITPFLNEQKKEYVAEIRLGIKTDTDDITGKVIEEKPVPTLSLTQIQEVLDEFRGEITQNPPVFSALRVNGKRFYEISRAGEKIIPKPRAVTIYELEMLNFAQTILEIRTVVSKGTYIRALARDIGDKLGCGATLTALTRTRIGNFFLKDAQNLNELSYDNLTNQLCPISQALSDLATAYINEAAIKNLLAGQLLSQSAIQSYHSKNGTGTTVKVIDPNEKVLAIALRTSEGLKPLRLIYADISKTI